MAEKFLSQKRAEKFHWNPVPRQTKSGGRAHDALKSKLREPQERRQFGFVVWHLLLCTACPSMERLESSPIRIF